MIFNNYDRLIMLLSLFLIWFSEASFSLQPIRNKKISVNINIDFISISPDSSLIITTWYNEANIKDAITGEILYTLKGHEGNIKSALFSSDGTLVLTASDDATAKIWMTATGKLSNTLQGHNAGVKSAHFNPDGTLVLTVSYDGTVKIWNTVTAEPLYTLPAYEAYFSPDGNTILTISRTNIANIWDANTGRMLHALQYYTQECGKPSFSPDSGMIISTCGKYAKIWNTRTGEIIKSLLVCNPMIKQSFQSLMDIKPLSVACFSPDGTLVMTVSKDGTIWRWDTSNWSSFPEKIEISFPPERSAPLIDHASAYFSPDSAMIIAPSLAMNKGLRVFDAKTGKQLYWLEYKDCDNFQCMIDDEKVFISPDCTMLIHKTRLYSHGADWEIWELPPKNNSLVWLSLKPLLECYPRTPKFRSYGHFLEWLASSKNMTVEEIDIIIKAALNKGTIIRYVSAMLLDTPQERL